jgi:hypothetical protein
VNIRCDTIDDFTDSSFCVGNPGSLRRAGRVIFIATLVLQLTFQTFATGYALHGTERFGVRPDDVTIGFIAWAVGGVLGALPAGIIDVRIGRRNAMLSWP